MPRYKQMGRMDDPVLAEGDRGFRGIDSYLEPTTLEGGLVEASQNMRLDGDLASVRKGIEFKAGAVTLTYSAGTEEVFASTLFSDPATGNEYIACATKDKVILWNDSNNTGIYVDYTGSEVVAAADGASFCQSLEKLILFRGTGKDPLEWDGVFTDTNGDGTVDSTFNLKNNGSPTAGRIECPRTDFGVFFANRLIVPQPSDSAYTIIMSDLLDTDNFYAAESQFRINRGTADRLVGFTPYLENQLLVFFRNSIHLINNVATTSAAAVFEITRQRGCVARKSVAASGPQIYFLSDDGVFTLQQGLDPAKGLGVAISKVSGEAIPLSRPIQDQFKEVNYAAADKACGIVFDNKYFLACPTGSSTDNNKIFVYDILNTAWTSIDSFPAGFVIDDFVTVLHGSNPQKRRLFAVNDKGWHLVDEATTDITGTIGSASTTSTAISAKLKTRSFTLGSIDVKSWKRGQLGCEVNNGDQFTIKVNTTDPDRSTTVHTENYSGSAEEKLIRFGSGRARGYAANVEIDVTAGRPSFRHVSLEAIAGGANARREIA
jgi:hypothetical protein